MIIFVGVLFTIAFTFFIALLCGTVASFVDIPSLIAVGVPVIFFCCVTKSGKTIKNYIISSLRKNYVYNINELKAIKAAAKNMVKISFWSGLFCFFAGLVALLANLSNPDALGPSLAVSLITLLYSVAVGYFIFFPLQAWAENRENMKQIGIEAIND